jgi:Replication protein
LQGSRPPRNAGKESGATLSSYLRDNSDLEIGSKCLSDQRITEIPRVEGFGGSEVQEPKLLSECSPRDKSWDRHRADAEEISRMYRGHPDFRNLAGRMAMCALSLGFAWGPDRRDENGTLTLKLRDARFCRVRLCPICQWRRCLMWNARSFQASKDLQSLHPRAKVRLPYPNSPERQCSRVAGNPPTHEQGVGASVAASTIRSRSGVDTVDRSNARR